MLRAAEQLKSKGKRCPSAGTISDLGGGGRNVRRHQDKRHQVPPSTAQKSGPARTTGDAQPRVMVHAMEGGGTAPLWALAGATEKEQGPRRRQRSSVTKMSIFYSVCKKHQEMLKAIWEETGGSRLQSWKEACKERNSVL